VTLVNQPDSTGTSAVIRNQIRVLDIAQGFFQSDILFALLKLRVFEALDGKSSTAAELAGPLKVRPDYLDRLLNAGRMLRLLESADGVTYSLSPLSQAVLAPSAGENYLGSWMRWLEYLRTATSKLDQTVRTGTQSIEGSAHLGGDPTETREFVLAMHNYAALRGKDLAEQLDTTGCTALLDVGCGPGTFAFHLGAKNPGLDIHLLDLPPILEVAREVRGFYDIPNQVFYHPQDALKDEIPGQYDLILVSNILQMLGERASRELLKRLFHSVRPGGSLVVQGQYMEERSVPVPQRWPVVFDLLQMTMTPEGRNHTMAETDVWLREAGFGEVEHVPSRMFGTTSYVRGWRR
jgi:hypothetical protein